MNKEEMINLLLRDIELDRFRSGRLAGAENEQVENDLKTEMTSLSVLSYAEIEALYLKSDGLYTMPD
ncbi:MAG TPA: hypothetical protein VMV91_01570 [Rhodocyclaceae bacterium]|nr:hypothetical protein [Rhodocyclaceae bacterium]